MSKQGDFAKVKFDSCVRLARQCSRWSWQLEDNPKGSHKREYLRIKREAISDARKWRDQLTK